MVSTPWLSLKRGFGECRHGFGGWDELVGFTGFSRFRLKNSLITTTTIVNYFYKSSILDI